MSMRMTRRILVSIPFMLITMYCAGCSVFEGTVEPLSEQKDLDFEYSGLLCTRPQNLEAMIPEWAWEEFEKKDMYAAVRKASHASTAVVVNVRLISMPRKCARQLLDSKWLGFYLAGVKSDEVDQRLEELVQQERAFVENDLTININDGEGGLCSHLGKTSYVNSAGLVAVRGAMAANPDVEEAQEGVIIALRPHVVPDGKSLEMELVLVQGRLERPVPHLSASLHGTQDQFVLQVPVTALHQLQAAFTLHDQGTIMIAGMDGEEEEDVRLAFIRARITEIPDGGGS